MSRLKDFGHYPIDPFLDEIGKAVLDHPFVLVNASPGAGKTTRVPLHLLNVLEGEIWVLEPRRLATRLTAQRCAYFLNEPCGRRVGYRMRQDAQVSDQTRLLFLTEGLFVRLLEGNPTLKGVSAVVLDEFHERNIHTDLAFALLRRLQSEQPHLRGVIMSATLNTGQVEEALASTGIQRFDVAGKLYPVEELYRPPALRTPWEGHLVDLIGEVEADLIAQGSGSALVFLPGRGEIERVKRALGSKLPVQELGSWVSPHKQKSLFSPEQKIILSTNVAETSVTLPDVSVVVDSGLARIAGHAPWSGMPTLELKKISQASAIQRAGRAGRTRSGKVVRLYDRADYLSREEYTPSDISRLDLAHVYLDLLALGFDPETLPWLEAPDEKNLTSALRLLHFLGAIQPSTQKLTELGKYLAQIPLHPRLGAIVFQAHQEGEGELGLIAACLLNEEKPSSGNRNKEWIHAEEGDSDLNASIQYFLKRGEEPRFTSVKKLYESVARRINQSSPMEKKILPLSQMIQKIQDSPLDRLPRYVLSGFPDRVAKAQFTSSVKGSRSKREPRYHFALGRGGRLAESSLLNHPNVWPEFLVALEGVESLKGGKGAQGTLIRQAVKIQRSELERDPGGLISEKVVRREDGVFREKRYGEFLLSEEKIELSENQSLLERVQQSWPSPFESGEDLEIYNCKARLLKSARLGDLPVYEGEMFELLLSEICEGKSSESELLESRLSDLIFFTLSYDDQQKLREFCPDELTLSNGRKIKVTYAPPEGVSLRGLLQDFYGVAETPLIAGAPVRVELLAPNSRIAQITQDLGGFWRGSYQEVRKELSRRYPKHYWPENPSHAAPILLKKNLRT